MEIALGCLVLAALFTQGMSTCTYSQGRREITAFGRTRYLCDFPVTTNGSQASITFEFGSKFSTSDCNECECTADGMRCCGFGIKSGTPIYAPAGCQVLADGCRARVVHMSDNRTDCYAYNQYRRPSGPFDPFMPNPYGMFGMGGGYGGVNGQRRGQFNGGEMESEGLLPMLLPLLLGSDPGMAGGMAGGMTGGMAGGMAGTPTPGRSNAGAGPNGAGADAEAGPAMSPFQGLSRMPPLMRLLFMSSMMSS